MPCCVLSRRFQASGRHTATLLANGNVLLAGGNAGLNTELYDPAAGTWTTIGSLRSPHSGHSATLLANGKVLLAGGYGGNDVSACSELFDPAGGTWTATGPLNSVRGNHTATLLPNGHVLAVGGDSGESLAELYNPAAGTWTPTAGLNSGRSSHTATVLADGKILVAGGAAGGALASTELYEYANGTWTSTTPMNSAGEWQTATVLPDGKLLVAGAAYTETGCVGSAELYDSATGTWTRTGAPNIPRLRHQANLLANGKVLITGGFSNAVFWSSAELYDPAAGTWTMTGSMRGNGYYHTATLLRSGKVLVAHAGSSDNAELYDPVSGTWSLTGSMQFGRALHTATLLANGKVLVVGGSRMVDGPFLASAELYDPVTGAWSATGSLNQARKLHTATLLPNGQVLVAGGGCNYCYSGPNVSSAELYDPVTGTWAYTGWLSRPRSHHAAALLANGKVLVAGGADHAMIDPPELYDPFTGTWTLTSLTSIGRWHHTLTFLPNGQVLLAGGWSDKGGLLAKAELYDVGLGFDAAWRPRITSATSPVARQGSLKLDGSRFRGVSEASGGNSGQSSAADYPVVQLRYLANDQTAWLPCTNWSAGSFASRPVAGLPAGWVMATVFANGIPGTATLVRLDAAVLPPLRLTEVSILPGGSCRIGFTNLPALGFTVLSATNPALPLAAWTVRATATEVSPGRYEFTDAQTADAPQRFYRVRSP